MRLCIVLLVVTILTFAKAGHDVEDLNLDTSASALAKASDDFGHIISNAPFGVASPFNVDELKEIVKTAHKNNVKIAPVGSSHSVLGQAQAGNGIVVNMTHFDQVLSVDTESMTAWVEAGATWRELLLATLEFDLTPPVFTDYLELSIGGVLSVGGKGPSTFLAGFETDNVVTLEVVDGKGKVYNCSATERDDLFYGVLAGLGQFGIITKAEVRLEPVRPQARFIRTLYTDFDTFESDLFFLINEENPRYDGVQGFAGYNTPAGMSILAGLSFPNLEVPLGSGRYVYMIEGTVYYHPENEPSVEDLLSGLYHIDEEEAIFVRDTTYYDIVARLDALESFLRFTGDWFLPHPWFNSFVPRSTGSDFVKAELDILNLEDVNGPILVHPFVRSPVHTPNIILPNEEEFIGFGLLRASADTSPARIQELRDDNAQLYARLRAAGGNGYLLDAVPLTPEGWSDHFGARYDELRALKIKYDPSNILTPGQNVFSFDESSSTSTSSTTSSTSTTSTTSTSSSTSSTEED